MSLRLSLGLVLLGLVGGAAQAADPIRIGAVLPFSGGVELYGAQAKLGLDLAVKDINAGGGILGRPVEVIYRDDGTRPNIATEAARKAVEEDGVLAVVGPITSQNLDAMVPVLATHRTPLIYGTDYEGGQCNRYMFALGSVPNQELEALLPYMTRTFGREYFLLGADRDWPHRMFEAAEPVIAREGGKIVGKQYTLGAAQDFASLGQQIADSKAEVLLYALKGDGMQFIPYAAERGLLKTTTVAFLGLTEADIKVFGDKGDDIYGMVPFVVTSQEPKAKTFMERARALAGPGMAVSNLVETHYTTLLAVKAALEKAGKVDKEALVDALEGLKFEAPSGTVTIGKDHHATLNMFLVKTRNQEPVEVQRFSEVAPHSGCKPEAFGR
jgi:branched-chain amino acid transport system substrate-binding protein/urea transport system substrate-binding protein